MLSHLPIESVVPVLVSPLKVQNYIKREMKLVFLFVCISKYFPKYNRSVVLELRSVYHWKSERNFQKVRNNLEFLGQPIG